MRINLLPPEIFEAQRIRRRAVLIGVAGVLVVVGLIGFAFLQQQRRATIEDDVATQQAVNAQLQQEVSSLQEFELLQQELDATRAELAVLLDNEVAWSGVLRDISLIIPSEARLQSLTGTIFTAENTPIAEGQTDGVETGLIGQVTFSGEAFDHRVVALWLSRLEEVEGFVNPWLDSSAHITQGLEPSIFVSTVDLSDSAGVVHPGSA